MTKKLLMFAIKSCLFLAVTGVISVTSRPAVAGVIVGDKCADVGGNCSGRDCAESPTGTGEYVKLVPKTDIFIYRTVGSTSATITCGKWVHCANIKFADSEPDCASGTWTDSVPHRDYSCVAVTRVGGASCESLVTGSRQE